MDTLPCCLVFLILYVEGTISGNQDCGDTKLTASEEGGVLTSPGYPGDYANSLLCIWTIRASYGFNIKLVATDVALEPNGCIFDAVTVYDGDMAPDNYLGRICEIQKPTFVSSGPYLTLKFQTDGDTTSKGFRLTYTAGHFNDSCDGRLVALSYSQELQFPGHQPIYGSMQNCTWIIRTNYTKIQIVVKASTMRYNCVTERVRIYDGWSNNILGTFCGSEKPTYISFGSLVRINYFTDSSNAYSHFRLQYKGVDFNDVCGGDLHASSFNKYLTSPGYPSYYSSNLNCTWTITTTYTSMKLVVSESRLQGSSGCSRDYVTVYDELSNQELGRFCGHETPTYTSSSHVRVNFVTDYIGNYKGFRIQYRGGSFTDAQTCSSTYLKAAFNVAYITSPGYPYNYLNNLFCEWTITANTSYNIKLIVTDADMEKHSNCRYDYVQIYSGSRSLHNQIGKFCGSQRPHFVSPSNSITVTFTTDGNGFGKGFKLSYQSGHFPACASEVLTSFMSANHISSPFYPFQYPNDADCTWTIDTADSDLAVYIEITHLDTEGASSNCNSDYLQVFDDRYGYGKSIGKWCGSLTPPSQQSSGQYMFIKFHSDGTVRKTGFELEYSSKHISSFRKGSVTGAVIGGIAAGAVLIVGIVCFASYRLRKSRRMQTPGQRTASNPSGRTTVPHTPQQMVYIVGSNGPTHTPATFASPPSYNEVLANDQANQTEDPPPPYSSLGVTFDLSKPVNVDVGRTTRPDAYAPDTLPIIPRETMSQSCQGLNNRAGPTAI